MKWVLYVQFDWPMWCGFDIVPVRSDAPRQLVLLSQIGIEQRDHLTRFGVSIRYVGPRVVGFV